jgi:D-sedoheptulose 7-phosphate isomerase
MKAINCIRTVIFDIDGVFTSGEISVSEDGKESKSIDFKDIDAFFGLKKAGYKTAFITGESTPITEWFKNRFQPNYFYSGCKNKKKAVEEIALRENNSIKEICYIGDSHHDLPGFSSAGLKVCPQNASSDVKNICDVILNAYGGHGAIAELSIILNAKKTPKCIFEKTFQRSVNNHLLAIQELAKNLQHVKNLNNASNMIVDAFKAGKKLLLCGNGGSAADAQHIATELVSKFLIERKALNAETLTINTSTLTAIGNDYSFDIVFARQIEAKGVKGDVLLGLTTSGTSKNIIKAFEKCKELGLSSICLTGNNENKKLNELCDYVIRIPCSSTPRIQEAHILIGHIICEYIEESLFGEKR